LFVSIDWLIAFSLLMSFMRVDLALICLISDVTLVRKWFYFSRDLGKRWFLGSEVEFHLNLVNQLPF
jgi:hypothetical protein